MGRERPQVLRPGSGRRARAARCLNIVGGLDVPDEGRVSVDGLDLSELGEDELLALRRDRVGFVFQSFGPIPIRTAAENVGVPIRLRRTEVREGEERVELLIALVALVGLADHAAQRAGEWHAAMELLRAVVDGEQVTALVATHDATLLDLAGRVLELRDGEIVEP